ncbi:hypothetical protein UUU_02980 (plasmid) [Klebsiella pneumoniae subsp. pneumoniae DSM 30104 = JCM 1662 = NBRC 14940]|nr:hypothetical protein UUU_02980 [Klebsiella pneumoniae subsp. pneumoniae DSM 30104 = JCM 1662 = NBRC 14940]
MQHPAQMIKGLYGFFFTSCLTEVLTNNVAQYLHLRYHRIPHSFLLSFIRCR